MHELIAAFSPERMGTYHEAVSGDHDKAALLYVWNAKVGAAFYGPLQAVEVTLRNAMHRELSRCRAVGEAHPLAQEEGVGLAVLRDLPAMGQDRG